MNQFRQEDQFMVKFHFVKIMSQLLLRYKNLTQTYFPLLVVFFLIPIFHHHIFTFVPLFFFQFVSFFNVFRKFLVPKADNPS